MMRVLTSLLGGALLAGCVGAELTEDTSDITVYERWPDCHYTSLGPVVGRDGMQPSQNAANHTLSSRWTSQGTDKNALQRLKLAARDKGADGVVIVLRTRNQPPGWEPSRKSAIKRAATEVIYKGIAIRGCDSQR